MPLAAPVMRATLPRSVRFGQSLRAGGLPLKMSRSHWNAGSGNHHPNLGLHHTTPWKAISRLAIIARRPAKRRITPRLQPMSDYVSVRRSTILGESAHVTVPTAGSCPLRLMQASAAARQWPRTARDCNRWPFCHITFRIPTANIQTGSTRQYGTRIVVRRA